MWDGFADFIHMGGHGPYVWGAYGVCAVVMAVEFLQVARKRRSVMSMLRRRQLRQRMVDTDSRSEVER